MINIFKEIKYMMNKTESPAACPCCENHCPSDDLKCGRGKAHFGLISEGRGGVYHENREIKTLEDEVIVLLHHSAEQASDHAALLSILSEEEKRNLAALLKKCLQSWENGSAGAEKR